MTTTLTFNDCLGNFELPRSAPQLQAARPQQMRQAIVPLSATIRQIEPIRVSQRVTYRLSADEHQILYSALKESLEIRTTLQRD